MADSSLQLLVSSAVTIGVVHSIVGVDHWLPFVVLGRARDWTLRQVLLLTAACGLGHIASSLALGFVGIGLGTAITEVERVEQSRGELAAWLMIAFGLTYAAWSFARTRRQQAHAHAHPDGLVHSAEECEGQERSTRRDGVLTAGGLFILFTLAPSEPLVPLLMIPAFDYGVGAALVVGLSYGVVTVATMLAAVAIGYRGLHLPSFQRLERHAHTVVGLVIALSGVMLQLASH